MALKVLMVGGRRCGKTSALAVMFNQMINGVTSNFFTTADSTQYVEKVNSLGKSEKQDILNAKVLELKKFLSNTNTNTFLVDASPTFCDWLYKIKMQIPGTSKNMEIEYTDVPGEWFRSGDHDDEITAHVKKNDVFVIIVDTPYLMETPDYMYDAVNCISDIHNVLTHIDDEKGTNAKMVVFVPIKCEKWIKEGKVKDVVERLKVAYDTPIKALIAYKKMSVCILPIETAGNIHFSEMKEAFKLNGNAPADRCCQVSQNKVRMGDGKFRSITENDTLNPDMDAVMGNTGIARPYAWFHVDNNSEPHGYAPRNCDQLTLHILNFYVQKTLAKAWGGLLGDMFSFFFGAIKKEDMIKKMSELSAANVIKENVDGIEYLKKAF